MNAKNNHLTKTRSARLLAFMVLCCASSTAWCESVSVFCDKTVPQIAFAAGDIKKALEGNGHTVVEKTLAELNAGVTGKKIIIARKSDNSAIALLTTQGGSINAGILGEQAYAMRTTTAPGLSYWAIGGDANGAMYGGLQIAENINFGNLAKSYHEDESPKLKQRGIKFNIPWDERSQTYFNDFEGTAHQEAVRLVWDMNFWKTWFDEMARHRYNALSLWSNHPFTSLIKTPAGFPDMALKKVIGFKQGVYDTEEEILNPITKKSWTIDEKIQFWKDVMKYGNDRGFNIYLMTWNIFLRGELNKAEMSAQGLTEEIGNQKTKDYIRASTKALFQTYPYLSGFGVTVGENMGEMPSGSDPTDIQKSQWAYDSYGLGLMDYAKENLGRSLRFIHRSWMADLADIKSVFQPLQALDNVQVDISYKYAIGHAHAAPKPGYWQQHDMTKKCIDNGFKSWLTIRNDDYYYLHWADPSFVKEFINGYDHSIVEATYVGSDGWTFTNNFTSKDGYYNGPSAVKPYAIQKTWMMQKLWGRIGYNPNVADTSLFKDHIGFAYNIDTNKTDYLYNAWTTASRANCRIGELVTGDWNIDQDYWPEAWTDTEQNVGDRFLTLNLMPDGKPANKFMPPPGSIYANIYDSAQGNSLGGKTSALVGINLIASQSEDALKQLATFKAAHILGSSNDQIELGMLLKDVESLAYLAQYGANKLNARYALWEKTGTVDTRNAKARDFMGKAYAYWKKYTALMDGQYKGANLQRNARLPNWTFNDGKALKEFTDLKGPTGTGSLVTFSSPADLASFTANTNVAVGVNVTITGRTVSKVELFRNGVSAGTATTSPYSFTLTNLVAGAHSLEARVTDNTGAISYAVNTIASKTAVLLKPDITSPTTSSATVGVPFTYTIMANNSPTSFGASGLPASLSISGNVVSGTFTASGSFTFTVTATNDAGTDSQLVNSTVSVSGGGSTTPAKPAVDNFTSSTPTLSGTTTANALITIYDNGVKIGTVTANGSGIWTYTVAPPLSAGIHVLTVTSTAPSAAESAPSLGETITVSGGSTTPSAPSSGEKSSSCGLGRALAFFLLFTGLWRQTLVRAERKNK